MGNSSQASRSAGQEPYEASEFGAEPMDGYPPRMGESVITSFGPGYVEAYRPEDTTYVVVMKNWQLDKGVLVRGYFQLESLRKLPSARGKARAALAANYGMLLDNIPQIETNGVYPGGTDVLTSVGAGSIDSYIVKDGMYQVTLTATLSDDVPTQQLFSPDSLERLVVGKKNDYVDTDFGTGCLIGVRPVDGVHVVVLHQDGGSGRCFGFFQPHSILKTLVASAGCRVNTPFGKGTVERYRREDDMYVVALDWRINDEKENVQAIFNGEALTEVQAFEGMTSIDKNYSKNGSCSTM